MPKARSQLSRNTSEARRRRNRISVENAEQRRNRLSQMSEHNANQRQQQNDVQTELRLMQSRVAARNRRSRESESQHALRIEEQRERSARNRLQSIIRLESKFAFNYNPQLDYINYKEIQIGKMDKICSKCHAKKWKDEPLGLCCSNGKVNLPNLENQPELIKNLVQGSHPLSKHFLDRARQYNTLFQMTSFGAEEIKEGNFMPTYKIRGQVYHRIGSLLPQPGESHQFLQIYFLPDDDQISTRQNIIPNLKRGLIELLQSELQGNNRLIQSFKMNLQNHHEIRNFKLVIHADQVPVDQHRGRYNAPTANEVAVLIVDEEKGPRDIVLRTQDGQLQRVSELHRSYDALQYPLLHFLGEDGYSINIPLQNNANNKTVSCMQFYAYRFMIRENHEVILHYFKNLFNQYAVDMGAKMISERLRFIRNNQNQLRADEYIHLRDAVESDASVDVANVGQRVILPSSVTGSPRYMREKTQDGMTYAREYGNADLFITFTCNRNWPEIKNELFENQNPADRHDLISRVFHLKLKKFMNFLKKGEIFGRVKCSMYTVEWQKRGLPHAHILLWLEKKIQPDEIDKIISAELPNKEVDPLLFDIVCKSMIHGPCGEYNNNSPCMCNGRCSKRYPRNFVKETQTGIDGYPLYRRRSPEDGGFFFTLDVRGKTVQIDNRWVVPYCPVLSRSFDAHINVESCHSIKSIQYITKYINKGSDQATFTINNEQDEVSNYLNGMYLCTSQSFWRIFGFDIHGHDPAITHLAVHLENNQRVYFTRETAHNVLENPRKTTLTAFFELCQSDDFAKTLLYCQVAAYYTWKNNQFHRRKQGQDVDGHPGIKKGTAIGRVYTIHPTQSECFHLRLLLHHVFGPTSFDYLKTVDGVLHPTFKSACQALGLLEDDNHWKNTLTDAALSHSSSQMRDLFAIILGFCYPTQPSTLWEMFQTDFCHDILHQKRQRTNNFDLSYSDEIFNEGLILLEDKVLSLFEKNLSEFGLPTPVRNQQMRKDAYNSIFRDEYDVTELENFVLSNAPKLVPDQRRAFTSVTESVGKNLGKVFFLDAPGGTGKTWLINLLLAHVRSTGDIAIAVASSGIAATLLNGGRTAHSTFKLKLNVNCHDEFFCNIRKNGPFADNLRKTKLIVWDECTMTHRAHGEALDRTLRDIRSCDKLMGGVTFVFAGDFRQTLPVIPRGTRADIVKACLKASPIWTKVETLQLRTNMRAHLGGSDSEFPSKLLQIGDGTAENDDGFITVDKNLGEIVRSVEDLISKVYPDISDLTEKPFTWLCERTILTPRNSTAEEINDIILGKFEGDIKEYRALDTAIEDSQSVDFPTEFLNSINPTGFPPYKLRLKIGVPIMLLRNLNPPRLCNGTRLQVKVMRDNVIEATILTGPGKGEPAFIPRIPMIPTDLPFQFKRVQFPVKLSFAMTINKGQGQTYEYVGVDLRTECFTHGQPYVGFSRTGNPKNQFILLPTNNKTKNIVYTEIL